MAESHVQHEVRSTLGDERGIALLMTVILLLLISAIGVTALQHAQDEGVSGSSSRRKITTLYAADALLKLVTNQLAGSQSLFPDVSPIEQLGFVETHSGVFVDARTGSAESGAAQPIQRVGRTVRDGGQINTGSANTFSFGIYRASVVATDPGGGSAQLQAQYVINEGAASYR